MVIVRATLKHNKREKKAFAQGLNGGKRSGRTPGGSLARKNANIPEVVKVNNYRKDFCLCSKYFSSAFATCQDIIKIQTLN
jgi:hypothetical protein